MLYPTANHWVTPTNMFGGAGVEIYYKEGVTVEKQITGGAGYPTTTL